MYMYMHLYSSLVLPFSLVVPPSFPLSLPLILPSLCPSLSLRNRTLDFRLRTRVEKRSGRDLMRKFKVFAHSNCVRKASASGFYGLPAAGALVRFLTDARAAIDNHARPKVGQARTRPTRPVPAGLWSSS